MERSPFFTDSLRRRMCDDLQLAGVRQRTHDGYLRAVRQLPDYGKASPDQISEDQLRQFFLHLTETAEADSRQVIERVFHRDVFPKAGGRK